MLTAASAASPSQSALGAAESAAVSTTAAQQPAALVVVQRDWNGWRKAMAPLAALEGVHWHQPPGAPRPLIHAYVTCDALVSGDGPHECVDGSTPHRLLVCLLKCHIAPLVYEVLSARANTAMPSTASA
jgi:hypothetical protein